MDLASANSLQRGLLSVERTFDQLRQQCHVDADKFYPCSLRRITGWVAFDQHTSTITSKTNSLESAPLPPTQTHRLSLLASGLFRTQEMWAKVRVSAGSRGGAPVGLLQNLLQLLGNFVPQTSYGRRSGRRRSPKAIANFVPSDVRKEQNLS